MTRAAQWQAVIAACCLVPTAALSGETPQRQLGAHQHGHGRLSIAVEGNKIVIELGAPGMDIVGFEQEASTPEQKAAVDGARAKLVNLSTLVRLPDGAGCRQVGGEVDMAGEHDHDHGGDKPPEAGAKKDSHEGHSEIRAEYWLECANATALTSLSFDYFKAFAGAQELGVEVVTGKGASKFEVSREKPDIDLAGLM